MSDDFQTVVERELEQLRSEVDKLKQTKQAGETAPKFDISKEEISAAGILSIFLWYVAIVPGVYFSLEIAGYGGKRVALFMVNLFGPPLLHLATLVPLMDRDRQILEAVVMLGYGVFIIYEMTLSWRSPLLQGLMVGGAFVMFHLHLREIYRRKQGLDYVDLDLDLEQQDNDDYGRADERSNDEN
ncbi:hypothetical protein CJU90_1671 [Yarrowia sp. C11]|nr:hypothetical protein CKK34_0394 [Yarrowia sp. E02]KAG5371625.1 hypothetical protein CJU90_1671 [Yarrowia sp. C11]